MLMAHPAPPALALHLLDAQTIPLTPKAGTNCPSIDRALQGGLSYGQVTALEGPRGTGKTLVRPPSLIPCPQRSKPLQLTSPKTYQVALHILATHLLSSPTARAAIIDTRGIHSPPYLLRDVMQARLSGDMGKMEGVLERVQVMRVFDVWGLCEGVEEVGKGVRGEGTWDEQRVDQKKEVLEIADTEGEDSEFSDSDTKPTLHHTPLPPSTLLLIDLLTPPFTTLMQTSPSLALSLLHTLLRTLRHLTTSHSLLTLILNSSYLSYDNTSSTLSPSVNHSPSIFSTTGSQYRPALGRSFGYCVDVRVLLSRVMRGGKDAEDRVLGREGGREVSVLEVVGERSGGRGGLWGGWECKDGVSLRDAFLQNT
ncbi:hypothetical protein FGG08_002734 [Glutinoglossum americanum]|uniref:Uncharacterized protein n=1 Tax=Glutinoglossum americanum TaxID=1670608 RepID=A0A9P8L5B6_9PEZI|nr:hypothetical protein FGG08_002734 [Glutinoglossum americanum]